jgi:hypothetical protein
MLAREKQGKPMTGRKPQRRTFQGDRAPIRRAPSHGAEQLSELFRGDEVRVVEQTGGWLRCEHAGTAVSGYVWQPQLESGRFRPTHAVRLPLAYLYAEPSQLAFTPRWLPMNATIRLTGDAAPLLYPGGRPGMPSYRLETGEWIVSSAVAAAGEADGDIASVARRFLHTPYVSGGRSHAGMDEGGLVHTVLARLGWRVPHVRLGQAGTLLRQLTPSPDARRAGGILASDAFLGIWTSDETVVFASAADMCVVERDGHEVLRELGARSAQPLQPMLPRLRA